MKGLKRNEIILFILSIVFLICVVPLMVYTFFIPKFRVKRFDEVVELNYNSQESQIFGDVCYGSLFSCKEVKVTKDKEVDTSKVGEYEVTYTYDYHGKKLEKKQTIKVVDKDSPVLSVEDKEYHVCPNGKVLDVQATASDEYDGDLTDKIVTEWKENKVVFSIMDSNGNTTSVEREGKVLDEEAPIMTLNGEQTMYLSIQNPYTEPGVTVTDNCDGDISSKVVIEGTVDSTKTGQYDITYKVKDESGNEASLVRNVFIYSPDNQSVTPNGKSIYLTFDDGPGPYTGKLLDILKKYNVKATFFVTNQGLTKGYDNLILRAYQEGHTIGLHSNTHNYNIYTNETTYFNDLYAIQDKVKKITGYTSNIIRFPGGSSNTISQSYDGGSRIMSRLTQAVEAKGFRYFDWNVTSGDAGETTSTAVVVSNVINALGSSNTYVVLQHDTKSFSVDAVESIIQYGFSHGYTFRSLNMSSPTVHHRINN